MITVSVRDVEENKKEARIEVEWKKIKPDYDDLLSEYMKLPVPGFRPGKAPKARVEKQYQREILDDVAARCVRRISREALEDKGITTTGPVSITDIDISHSEPFRFTATFTELPDFDLPDYGGFVLTSGADDEKRDEISMRLLGETSVDIPDELVRQELSFDDDTGSGPGDEAWGAAMQRVKLLLILSKIAHQDGIDVDDKDLEERIQQIASLHNTKPGLLKGTLLRNGGLSRLSRFLLAEKTLDYLIDICSNRANSKNDSN